MAARARRARSAPRLEVLERRALLSGDAGELFVKFVPNAPAAAVRSALESVGGNVVRSYPDGTDLVTLGAGRDVDRALAALRGNPKVRYAEADATFHTTAAVVPNDPSFGRQWGLNNGNNVDIDAPQAWGITQGRSAIIVAVLDTGIDQGNPDLVNRLWTNPQYGSGVDGYSTALHGWNFVGNNANIQDYNGHGSHVSGILAAAGNNGYGVAGVNWNSRIMPIKVLDSAGDGSTESAVSGIYFAVQHGARVINASWGGGDYSQAMADAIAYANARGVVFVTAAGNDGLNSDVSPSYPGSYRLPNEITVGAADSSGRLASFSDYGGGVQIAAPGVNIWSTTLGGFTALSGTSMATPYVAGVVSLVLGLHPEYTAAQAVSRVLATAKRLPALAGRVATGGIVDAFNAVNFVSATSTGGDGSQLVPNGSTDEAVFARILASNTGASDADFVAALYQTVTGRAADPAGLSSWVGRLQSGQTRLQVAQAFVATTEALLTKVAHWYQDALGSRQSLAQLKLDPGVAYWSRMLAAGQSGDAVLARILSSAPYWADQGSTNQGFVTGLYHSLLGRAPDPAGLAYFVGLLQQGASPLDVVQAVQGTPEAKRTKVARWYQQAGSRLALDVLKVDGGVQHWAGFLGGP